MSAPDDDNRFEVKAWTLVLTLTLVAALVFLELGENQMRGLSEKLTGVTKARVREEILHDLLDHSESDEMQDLREKLMGVHEPRVRGAILNHAIDPAGSDELRVAADLAGRAQRWASYAKMACFMSLIFSGRLCQCALEAGRRKKVAE